MGSLTCAEMRRLEDVAFKQGATAEDLMEKAGLGIARAILRRYPESGRESGRGSGRESGTAIACIGSGNNGGDALVAVRHLADAGWEIGVKCGHTRSQLGILPRKKWRELDERGALTVDSDKVDDDALGDPRPLGSLGPLVLLDGLLGIGSQGALRSPLDQLAVWINHTRTHQGADVVAMDIPSGLDGDTGHVYEGAVVADLTLTVAVPKTGLFSHSAANFTGAIERVPLLELPVPDHLDASRPYLNDVHSLRDIPIRRPHDFHKGDAGRVGILAGSRGMLGAAVLCAKGALHAGAGLVTLFIEEAMYSTLAPMLPPEVMLRPIGSLAEIDQVRLDAFAVGPGMGGEGGEVFFELLNRFKGPVVLDADGLNLISADGVEKHIRPNMVLTPHPGEMERMFPDLAKLSRLEAGRGFISRFAGTTLVLKGSRSLIAESHSPIYINGTGHAGMATGGQGDVLTGVIAALLGQGIESFVAARLGVWLCGRAAELAVSHGRASEQSMLASDVINWLGMAFRDLKGSSVIRATRAP